MTGVTFAGTIITVMNTRTGTDSCDSIFCAKQINWEQSTSGSGSARRVDRRPT